MFHDYTLTKLAKDHVRELLNEKQVHGGAKSRRPHYRQNRATSDSRSATSRGNRFDAAGACR